VIYDESGSAVGAATVVTNTGASFTEPLTITDVNEETGAVTAQVITDPVTGEELGTVFLDEQNRVVSVVDPVVEESGPQVPRISKEQIAEHLDNVWEHVVDSVQDVRDSEWVEERQEQIGEYYDTIRDEGEELYAGGSSTVGNAYNNAETYVEEDLSDTSLKWYALAFITFFGFFGAGLVLAFKGFDTIFWETAGAVVAFIVAVLLALFVAGRD
jgi:hypothetical protein